MVSVCISGVKWSLTGWQFGCFNKAFKVAKVWWKLLFLFSAFSLFSNEVYMCVERVMMRFFLKRVYWKALIYNKFDQSICWVVGMHLLWISLNKCYFWIFSINIPMFIILNFLEIQDDSWFNSRFRELNVCIFSFTIW